MDTQRINIESVIYTCAFLLAVILRFYNLGAAPLSEEEARWALQSLQIAKPALQTPEFSIGPQPAYVYLTAALFTVFGSTNFLARFWPAFLGSALVIIPFFFRLKIGRVAALIAAFGLAVDPGMVAVSRYAGGPMMALSFAFFALGFVFLKKSRSGGMLSGLTSLSGPSFFVGLTAGAASWITNRTLNQPKSESGSIGTEADQYLKNEPDQEEKEPETIDLRLFAISAGVAGLTVGTYFLMYPEGLVAWFKTIPAFLGGWILPSGVPSLRIAAALLVYQPFALLFGTLSLIRWFMFDRRIDRRPLLFVFAGFFAPVLLLLVYPGRQVSWLVWALIPLWCLASWELQNYLPSRNETKISIVFAAIVFILCVLFWNALIVSDQVLVVFGSLNIGVRLALAIGVLSILVLSVILISLGWNYRTSSRGLVWGISAALLIYTISLTWGVSHLRQNHPSELWYPSPGAGQHDLLDKTIEQISNRSTGFPKEIKILSTVETDSMRWILRDYPYANFTSVLPAADIPEVVITRSVDNLPVRGSSYRGQDFTWGLYAGWNGILPPGTLSWFTFREAPIESEMVILWVRSNLFPDENQDIKNETSDTIQ